jgi:raffinose/stachyose/melibiose transport system substrate-binding protein
MTRDSFPGSRLPKLRRLRRTGLLATAVACALLAAGCVPGTDGSAAGAGGADPGEGIPDPARAGKVTLTVWDQEIRGGQNAEIQRLNGEFEKKYANVRIKRVSRSFADLKTTLKLALSSNTPPDVIQANQGYPDMVSFVKAGLLTPLDTYAGIYAWNTRYPNTLLNLNRVSADGSHFGTGRLYGISQTGEYIGIYYNKDVLARAGVPLPRTWQEFGAALPRLKQRGVLPVQLGNLDKYPAIHLFGVLQNSSGGAGATRDTILGRGPGFDNAPTRTAAATLAGWMKRGYLPHGTNGTGYDDAAKQFAAGKGAFLITGTWELADLAKPMGRALGIMPPPPTASGGAPVTTGGQGLAWSITSRSRHQQVAAAYLDFLTNPHAADVMTEEGVLPALPGKAAGRLAKSSANGQMVAGWKALNAHDGLVPYLDYTTPTFYDFLSARLQEVIGGTTPPGALPPAMQHEYAGFLAAQRAGRKAP